MARHAGDGGDGGTVADGASSGDPSSGNAQYAVTTGGSDGSGDAASAADATSQSGDGHADSGSSDSPGTAIRARGMDSGAARLSAGGAPALVQVAVRRTMAPSSE